MLFTRGSLNPQNGSSVQRTELKGGVKCNVLKTFLGIVQERNMNVAKKMSVIYSFCPRGQLSGFGVHSLWVCLSFWGSPHPVLNSCGPRLGSRESYTSSHTQGCATVTLQCTRGCGAFQLDFPMPFSNCGCIWDWGDLLCPPDPFTGPWPKGCVFAPAETLNRLCVYVLCVAVCQ